MGRPNSPLEALSYCAIRVRAGDSTGAVHTGTAFFYIFSAPDGEHYPSMVSNKHVLCNKEWIELDFAAAEPASGLRIFGKSTKLRIGRSELAVVEHPDPCIDLAAIPAIPLFDILRQRDVNPHMMSLSDRNLPNQRVKDALLPAMPILMVGFPNGLMDEANNLPVVRRGSLATPYRADYQGNSDFVIDIAAFGGSSGSPVFCLFENMIPGEHRPIRITKFPHAYFIGVLHSGPQATARGEIVTLPVPTTTTFAQTKIMLHLGYCVKASRMEELGIAMRSAVSKR